MRALTINRAGSTAAWEQTMKGLGLTVEMDSQTLEQMERDWNDVMMDSTKRKRRKKMKKHKLKKRRRPPVHLASRLDDDLHVYIL
ncbi:hypothetical protein PLEOSDRAFT_1091478 [Pleurotus ostreatus PC15]|uniref:Ribosomal protein mS38 C-terminal domain-containing protein n=1 Tax=Pleurotus ostreatus (strain PC15) TaxID=1137138 RepID=A0A067PC04_PLEO1|nr:hypothetical protein PLEOSDRAFT_1091478 [Pleurotus ostreatus PC15]